tara:strand:- start:230 stop:508 length:279 start_codon:yes stop_codon:yes gene_type:complete
MENKKTNDKEVLTETQIISEFIGSLVNAIFKGKANKLAKGFYSNPKLKKSLQKYIDDTNEFRKELKRLGLGNQEDLKKALADNPNLPNWKNY